VSLFLNAPILFLHEIEQAQWHEIVCTCYPNVRHLSTVSGYCFAGAFTGGK